MPTRKLKIALYSHDTVGLGHMRRNLAIAQALIQAKPDAAILMVAGAHEVGAFEIPSGVDCLTLPGLAKDEKGHYRPRSLAVPRQVLLALRAKTIQTAIGSFKPDVLIADKVPSGALGELLPTLEWLRTQRHARLILGLRDVLDDPHTVHREWKAGAYEAVIETYYDAVRVYGDPRIYDLVLEYGFSRDLGAKASYTGYLGRPISNYKEHPTQETLNLPAPNRLILCMVGGGQDGEHVASTFLQAKLPSDTTGLLITGPFMPPAIRQNLQTRVNLNTQFQMLVFVNEPEGLLKRADRVIAMGGYNMVSEILSYQKPALIVPRVNPRSEQLIRAERFAQVGLVDYIHPAQLTPKALTDWLASDLDSTQRDYSHIDLDGLNRLPSLLDKVLATAPQRQFAGTRSRYDVVPNNVG